MNLIIAMVLEHSTEMIMWLFGEPYKPLLWLCRMGAYRQSLRSWVLNYIKLLYQTLLYQASISDTTISSYYRHYYIKLLYQTLLYQATIVISRAFGVSLYTSSQTAKPGDSRGTCPHNTTEKEELLTMKLVLVWPLGCPDLAKKKSI